MKDEGLELIHYFNATFISTEEHKTSLPSAQQNFHSLRQIATKESASDFIARTDLAVSTNTLSKLGEPVSENTWIFALANGLKGLSNISLYDKHLVVSNLCTVD